MKMKLLFAFLLFILGCCFVEMSVAAATEEIGGITWTYTLSSGDATVTGMSDCTGTVVVPDHLGGCGVTALGPNSMCGKNFTRVVLPETLVTIGDDAFINCGVMEYIDIPKSVRMIGKSAFQGCSKLRKVVVPEGVTTLRFNTFLDCSGLEVLVLPSTLRTFDNSFYYQGVFMNCTRALVVAKCSPDIAGINESHLTDAQTFRCPHNLSGAWINKVGYGKFAGYSDSYFDCSVSIVSSSIRASDPTIMDVIYKVTSTKPTVKVRVLAFDDGVRSFARVVRPETFVDGTNGSVGDNIEANVEHKISWRVSGDWKTKLAKAKFEVLASEGELLPLETMTIPASDQYGKIKITWNAIGDSQVFDALLWLYADNDPDLTLSYGMLKNGAVQVANGTSVSAVNAMSYIYSKMGFSLLTGAPLAYANQETRLGLNPSGARQYGYKIVE